MVKPVTVGIKPGACCAQPWLAARGAGIRQLADIMREYGRSTERDFRKFASVGGEFGNGATWKRLGYLAEVLWPEEKTLAEEARKYLTAGTVKLDPRASRRGTLLRRWGLWINAAISNEA
jgi:predicted transcriptional regulator of viral defense system